MFVSLKYRMVLSTLGCQIFYWVGLMDQKGCEELRVQGKPALEPLAQHCDKQHTNIHNTSTHSTNSTHSTHNSHSTHKSAAHIILIIQTVQHLRNTFFLRRELGYTYVVQAVVRAHPRHHHPDLILARRLLLQSETERSCLTARSQ